METIFDMYPEYVKHIIFEYFLYVDCLYFARPTACCDWTHNDFSSLFIWDQTAKQLFSVL